MSHVPWLLIGRSVGLDLEVLRTRRAYGPGARGRSGPGRGWELHPWVIAEALGACTCLGREKTRELTRTGWKTVSLLLQLHVLGAARPSCWGLPARPSGARGSRLL